MDASKFVTIKKRAVSILLSIVMMFASIPSAILPALTADAAGPWGFGGLGGFGFGGYGPNVLTNVSVSFLDSKFKSITEVESGTMFYLSVQLAGNNVNNPWGTDNFRLEITDDNLLLTNFAGDGFVDGAVYNGFTLHVEDGKRYLEYDIRNGSTKMIRLQAKFANGTTPDGTTDTIKLVQTTSGKSVSGTIKAKSNFDWSQSKSESINRTDTNALKDGVKVDYTLSATSGNAGKKSGAWWAESMTFSDTITMPDGVTSTLTQDQLEASIKAAGFYDYTIHTFNNSGQTVTMNFTVNSNDTNKEMESVKINLPVTFKGELEDAAQISNGLKVSGKPINGDSTELGDDKVTVDVSKVEPPVIPDPEARFQITKSVDKSNITLTEDRDFNETVKYEITVRNYGDAAGTITLVEDPGTGITLGEGGFTEQEISLDVNEEKKFTIEAELSGTMSNGSAPTFINHVYDKNNVGNGAYAYTSVGKAQATFGVTKSGYVDNVGQTWFDDSSKKVCYTLKFNNWGSTEQTVHYEDVLDDACKEYITWNDASLALLSGEFTLAPADYSDPDKKYEKVIELHGTIKEGFTGNEIKNTVKTNNGNTDCTFTRAKVDLGIYKAIENNVQSFAPGDSLTYKIQVSNNGDIDAQDVTVKDEDLGTNFVDKGWEVTAISASCSNGTSDSDITADKLIAGHIVNIPAKSVYTVLVTVKAPESVDGDSVSNRAYYSYNGGDFHSSGDVTVKKQEHSAEKWIVDSTGKTLVQPDGTLVNGFDGFVDGDNATFRVKFTNNSNNTYEDLYMNDWSVLVGLQIPEIDAVNVKIIETTGNIGYPEGTVLSLPLTFNDADKYSAWQIKLEGINSTPSSSFVLEYTVELNAGDDSWRWYEPNNCVAFYGDRGYNVDHTGGLADATVIIPHSTSLSYNKTSNIASVNVGDADDINNVLTNGIDYTISLVPNNQDSANYSGSTFTITDVLPDGMTYKPGSIKVSNDDIETVGSPVFDLTTNTLTIKVKSSCSLSGWGASSRSITYTALISDKLAEQLKAIPASGSETIVNKVIKVEISGDSVNKTLETVAEAETKFTNSASKPGFSKSGVASLPGTFGAARDEFNAAEHGFITAGDSLVWDLIVYNGDGSDTDGAALNLGGKTITDMLPSCYSLGGVIGAGVVKLDGNGSYKSEMKNETGTLESLYSFNGGYLSTYPEAAVSGADTGKPVFTIPDGVKLDPNEAYVIRIWTQIKPGMETEGVVTNRGYLTLDDEYTQDSVAAGEPKGNEIWNSANYNIVGLTTESYKTINYTSQGHDKANGHRHTDPETADGISTNAAANYVQGMQGEDVTYELHIKNTSPVALENWSVIDRLPYVGDVGLVSGYERDSAFAVSMGDISSVMVGSEEISADNYKVSYSSDKKTVINEYSSDWTGGAGEMQWYDTKKSDTVNFRLELPDSVQLAPGDEIVITFTGTVPASVSKTGQDNIAWNSFAYSYQAPGVLGDTVMVAEPAKVGVWVEEPDVNFTLNVEKVLAENAQANISQSFYFAFFDKPSFDKNPTRLSDVYEIVVEPGEAVGSIELLKFDRYALSDLTQADQIYILETDKDGNQLKGYDVTYKTDAEQENAQLVSMTADEQTFTIKNEKSTGSIKATKEVVVQDGDSLAKDTFFAALFTWDEESQTYVRYAGAPVKKFIYDAENAENAQLTAEWTDIPADTDFYVFETDSTGKLADNKAISKEYTSSSGVKYNVAYSPSDPVTPDSENASEITITNTKKIVYKISVDKTLVIENHDKASGKFMIQLAEYELNKDGDTVSLGEERRSEIKAVTPGTTLTFELMDADNYGYRVYELYKDDDGTIDVDGVKYSRAESGNQYSFDYTYLSADKKEQLKKTGLLSVSYDGAGEVDKDNNPYYISLTPQYNSVSVGITNTDKNPNKITVNKTAIKVTNARATEYIKGHEFNVALFTLKTKPETDENGKPVLDENGKQIETPLDASKAESFERVPGVDVKTGTTNDKGVLEKPIVFDNLTAGKYYVLEVEEIDGEWVPRLSGDTIVQNGATFVVSYSTPMATLDGETPAEISVTDTTTDSVELMFSKIDVDGNLLEGVILNIAREDKADIEGSIKINDIDWDGTIDVDGSKNYKVISQGTDEYSPIIISGLPAGDYTLTETILLETNGYEAVNDQEFTIGEDGYFVPAQSDDDKYSPVSIKASSLTLTNRSKVSVSKYLVADGDNKTEKEGAVITIMRTDGSGLNKDVITYNNELKFSEDGKSLTFTSTNEETIIYGLPDGEYVLIEDAAPDTELEVVSDWKFKIENGVVVAGKNSLDKDSYVELDSTEGNVNHIIVNDAPKKISEIHISKKE
ncbi:MAG: hypothetical protein NC093_10705, partial [Alistipes sp.]|nr:hypothetical protein [Alistipes sp.]